jgi:hypothetical protein
MRESYVSRTYFIVVKMRKGAERRRGEERREDMQRAKGWKFVPYKHRCAINLTIIST